MKRQLLLKLIPTVLAIGCAGPTAPNRPKTPTTIPEEARLAPSSSRLDARPEIKFLKALSLDQAIQIAESSHPDLVKARARVEAAGGRALQAGLYPNPRAVARMESAPFNGRTTAESEYVVGISTPIYLSGRLSAAREVEDRDRERLLLEAEATRREVVARIRGSFATGLYAEGAVHAQDSAVRFNENGVAVAKALLSAQDALPEDVARAELELLQARVELDRAESLHQVALASLAAAIGETGLRVESLQGSLDATLEIPTLESLSMRLASHPSFRAAEAGVTTQRARIELAESQRIPEVNLDLFYRRLESSNENSFDVGISIPIPIFDRNQGKLREIEADLRAAEAEVRSVRIELGMRLQEAHARLVRSLGAARTLREEVIPRAETILKAAEARYALGDISLTEVLIARKSHNAVQLSHLESLREVMEAWARLSSYIDETEA